MHEELRVTFFVSSRVNVVTFITCPSDESVSSFVLLALEATINKALGFFYSSELTSKSLNSFAPQISVSFSSIMNMLES